MSTIKLLYFKPSGKWAYEGELEWNDDLSMYFLHDHIDELRFNKKLPGLSSGSWDGIIFIDTSSHPMGYPMMLKGIE